MSSEGTTRPDDDWNAVLERTGLAGVLDAAMECHSANIDPWKSDLPHMGSESRARAPVRSVTATPWNAQLNSFLAKVAVTAGANDRDGCVALLGKVKAWREEIVERLRDIDVLEFCGAFTSELPLDHRRAVSKAAQRGEIRRARDPYAPRRIYNYCWLDVLRWGSRHGDVRKAAADARQRWFATPAHEQRQYRLPLALPGRLRALERRIELLP